MGRLLLPNLPFLICHLCLCIPQTFAKMLHSAKREALPFTILKCVSIYQKREGRIYLAKYPVGLSLKIIG
jgi:hypothetical protein